MGRRTNRRPGPGFQSGCRPGGARDHLHDRLRQARRIHRSRSRVVAEPRNARPLPPTATPRTGNPAPGERTDALPCVASRGPGGPRLLQPCALASHLSIPTHTAPRRATGHAAAGKCLGPRRCACGNCLSCEASSRREMDARPLAESRLRAATFLRSIPPAAPVKVSSFATGRLGHKRTIQFTQPTRGRPRGHSTCDSPTGSEGAGV